MDFFWCLGGIRRYSSPEGAFLPNPDISYSSRALLTLLSITGDHQEKRGEEKQVFKKATMKEHKNVRDFLSFMTGDQQLLASSAGIVRNVSVTDLGGMPQPGK